MRQSYAQLAIHPHRKAGTVNTLPLICASKDVFGTEKSGGILYEQFTLVSGGKPRSFIDDLSNSLFSHFRIQHRTSRVMTIFHDHIAYNCLAAVFSLYLDFLLSSHQLICLDDFCFVFYGLLFFNDLI